VGAFRGGARKGGRHARHGAAVGRPRGSRRPHRRSRSGAALTLKALVIGGGIGGLSAAIALSQAGLDVEVFERANEIHEAGAGISLWANAIDALDRLGLGGAVRAASVAYEVGGLRRWDGAVISSVATQELVRILRIPVIVMHRADLIAALSQAVPSGVVRLGAACVSAEQDGEGVEASFVDGRRVRGDVLIGADGLDSVVRAGLHADGAPRYSGCTAWRAVVPFDTRQVRASETWGFGHLFGQVPISGDRVYWYAARNQPQGRVSARPKAELLQLFKGWHAPIEGLIGAAEESRILQNDIFDRPVLKRWGAGRMTLLGDAAHPMTPFMGQGACQAIEDAVALGRHLRAGQDVPSALRAYERERIPRANAFVNRSRQVGRLARLRNPVAVMLRNALLGRVSPERQARQLARMIRTT
jgi:2-polyprenyl-6-methoxyphenol hydroxylase-like FAD-dependent oxidoreductase